MTEGLPRPPTRRWPREHELPRPDVGCIPVPTGLEDSGRSSATCCQDFGATVERPPDRHGTLACVPPATLTNRPGKPVPRGFTNRPCAVLSRHPGDPALSGG